MSFIKDWCAKAPKPGQLNVGLRRALAGSTFFTQQEFAEAMDVSVASMRTYLREIDPVLPPVPVLLKICEVLGTHPNALLGYKDPEVSRLEKRYDEADRALVRTLGTLNAEYFNKIHSRAREPIVGFRYGDGSQVRGVES